MKILQIIPSLASGGAERFVVDLCNELSHQGEEVYLCVVQDPDEKDYGFYLHELNTNVKFYSLKRPKGFGFQNIKGFVKIINEIKPDIIHGHLSVLLYFYILKIIFWRVKVFYTIHSLADKASPGFLYRIINYVYFAIGWIKPITISDECDKSFQHYYGLENSNMIMNGRQKGIRSSSFHLVEEEISQYKLKETDIVFVHIARYHLLKNQAMLVQLFNKLTVENSNIHLLIIGDWTHCKEAIDISKSAGENIHILGTKKNVIDYLLVSDAFCLPSLYEGLPISLIEAISCACVPICTPVGGMVEIIQHGVTGYLSADCSEESYKEALMQYISQPYVIEKANLIRHYEESFSIEQAARNHIALYQK